MSFRYYIQSIFDAHFSLLFKEMSSSELRIKLTTIRSVSWSLFQFTLSFCMVSCTNHWMKLTNSSQEKDPSILMLLLGLGCYSNILTKQRKRAPDLACTTVWQTGIDCKNVYANICVCTYREEKVYTHMHPYMYRNWKVRLISTIHTVNQEAFINAVCKQFFKSLKVSEIHFVINMKLLHYTNYIYYLHVF